ncbi:MazG nucleotide pyrophosphohydrolase domain-containing protein, partial [Deinococcus sp. MIMF12]
MQELLTTLRRLRAPDGCPWDREQTHDSLRPYLLEEAAEAVDAVAEGPQALAAELGDVLLQVAFHSVIAEEAGAFGYADVERGIVEKLVRRHPHVFGDVQVADSGEVVANWQAIKAAERGGRPRRAADRV